MILVSEFGFHLRHVNFTWTVSTTPFTPNTEVEYLLDELVGECRLFDQFTTHCGTKHIRSASRGLDLFIGSTIRGTHNAACRLLLATTAATAVTQLRHSLEPVVVFPVELRLEVGVKLVLGTEPEMFGHIMVAEDVSGIEQPLGSNADFSEPNRSQS